MQDKHFYPTAQLYQERLMREFEEYHDGGEQWYQWYCIVSAGINMIGLIARRENFHIAISDMAHATDELYYEYYCKGQAITLEVITQVAKNWEG